MLNATQLFEQRLTTPERHLFSCLSTPAEIQAFLDEITYSREDRNRSPLNVLRDRQAHCLDGAVFAAAALRRLGYPPVIVDMLPEPGLDDDHVLAIYEQNGGLGALAKSNFTGLRSREPVYRSLRELVMSYFEDYFNVDGVKTLRGYTVPLNLETCDHQGWMWSEAPLNELERRLPRLRHFPLLNAAMVANLRALDPRSYQAGLLGARMGELFAP